MKRFWLAAAAALILTTMLPDGAFAQRGGFRGGGFGGGGFRGAAIGGGFRGAAMGGGFRGATVGGGFRGAGIRTPRSAAARSAQVSALPGAFVSAVSDAGPFRSQ